MRPHGHRWLLAAAVAVGIAFVGFAALVVVIRSGLQRYADEAVARFPGDRLEALMAVVECEDCPLKDRNHAVWALGQMAAEPALPVLEARYDGRKCTHETRLCQYELKKAIRMIERRRGLTGPVWRVIGNLHQPWR